MLYLRNTNQQQTLGKDIRRGVANSCCNPTLNSVVTASNTQLLVDTTLGNYLVDCKSCVGGYLQVSENNRATWTTITLGSCADENLVPMPSQSAYYRAFTSCSASDQPFDQLTSSFSNEILFVPNGRVNYNFVDTGDSYANFKLIVTGSTGLDTTESVNGILFVPSASAFSASITSLIVPTTGSVSMSLSITGSNVNFATSSCVSNSGSIFIGNTIIKPNEDYYVSASYNFRPENSCGNLQDLGYTVNSFDNVNKIWYHSNENGVPLINGGGLYPSASITGSAFKTNVVSGDCRFNAIQFSGSITLNFSERFGSVYLSIVTGSFGLNGNGIDGNGNLIGWGITNIRTGTSSGDVSLFGFNATNVPNKNALVGFSVGTFVGPFNRRDISLFVSGSNIATNPPTWANGPDNLGTSLTLSGEGIIRGFGTGRGTTTQQTTYNCIYETTPS